MSGGLVVQKYGGSSVADAARLFNVARRIVETYDRGHPVCAVVSARGDTTDDLVRQALQVSPQPAQRELDVLLSAGEGISCSLLAMAVNRLGRKAVSLTGPQTGIITDSAHGRAQIVEIHTDRIRAALDEGKIALVAGFQGVSRDADVTTLGRGGSDTTAVALASALQASVCEIYTDVDGVYTANPSVVLRARRISEITYEEMIELTGAGANVLATPCVELAARTALPVHVLSSFAPGGGTWVRGSLGDVVRPEARGITYTLDEVVFELHDVGDSSVTAPFLLTLTDAGIEYDATVSQESDRSSGRLVCVVHEKDALLADEVLSREVTNRGIGRLASSLSMSRVSVIGSGIANDEGLISAITKAFGDVARGPLWRASSGLRASGLVPRTRAEQTVAQLHEHLGLDEPHSEVTEEQGRP
jgi:aspartate kinase